MLFKFEINKICILPTNKDKFKLLFAHSCQIGFIAYNCLLKHMIYITLGKFAIVNGSSPLQKHIHTQNLLTAGVKSSHLYLYSAFNNTNCNKALHNIKIGKFCQ